MGNKVHWFVPFQSQSRKMTFTAGTICARSLQTRSKFMMNVFMCKYNRALPTKHIWYRRAHYMHTRVHINIFIYKFRAHTVCIELTHLPFTEETKVFKIAKPMISITIITNRSSRRNNMNWDPPKKVMQWVILIRTRFGDNRILLLHAYDVKHVDHIA